MSAILRSSSINYIEGENMLSRLNPWKLLKTVFIGALALQGGAGVAVAAQRPREWEFPYIAYGPHVNRETGGGDLLNYSPQDMQKLNSSCVYHTSYHFFGILGGSDLNASNPSQKDRPAIICVGGKREFKEEDFDTLLAIERKPEGTSVHVNTKTGLAADCETFVMVGQRQAEVGGGDAKEKLEEAARNPGFQHAFFPRVPAGKRAQPAAGCEPPRTATPK